MSDAQESKSVSEKPTEDGSKKRVRKEVEIYQPGQGKSLRASQEGSKRIKTELEKSKPLKDSSENNKRKREETAPEIKEIEKDEKREVPLSKRPATTTLLITGFVRPFTTQAVQELLAQYGKIMTLWMDSIKTKAFVTKVC